MDCTRDYTNRRVFELVRDVTGSELHLTFAVDEEEERVHRLQVTSHTRQIGEAWSWGVIIGIISPLTPVHRGCRARECPAYLTTPDSAAEAHFQLQKDNQT